MPTPAIIGFMGCRCCGFFAAFSVLLGHVMHEALSFAFGGTESPAIFAQNNFGAGVDVFFVVSGFIMFYISDGKFGQPGAQRAFLIRRLIGSCRSNWLLHASDARRHGGGTRPTCARGQLDIGHVLASFVFIPWADSTGLAHPVLGLGWTLNYEMFFYVVFSLALLLPQRLGVLAITGLFVGLTLVNALVGPTQTQIAFGPIRLSSNSCSASGLRCLREAPPTLHADCGSAAGGGGCGHRAPRRC
jgi:peptidoglycan/LPS O-acetylase OafA/YrhL